jgi:predicted ATPase
MFKTIEIENFKSIIKAKVNFAPLTVIVGANGSGKSNLIKALDFLSCIPRLGVVGAVSYFGGFRSLVPKAISTGDIRTTRTRFCYRTALSGPEGYDQSLPPLYVDHEITLARSGVRAIRVTKERLTFHQVLALTEVLSGDYDDNKAGRSRLERESWFALERGPRGAVMFESEPPLADELGMFVKWLGVQFAQDVITSASDLEALLKAIVARDPNRPDRPRKRGQQRYHSFLDPDVTSAVDLSPQASVFSTRLSNVRRFDLLLGELRPDQKAGDSLQLSANGSNMPSVLRHIRSISQSSWDRILRTVGIIAPHVTSIGSQGLRTGREFVEFTETAARRGVESWESSDGTLRALAILLALESHNRNSTILIEEPEQNLHPWAVRQIVEHMREVIEERRIQVIVTTHSPQVLEMVRPEEVLVSTRTDEDGTKFRTLEQILPDAKLLMGEVSRLWVKGLLGGVPSYE